MTIKQAKELSRQIIGRLPRCGHELCVASGTRQETVTQEWDGKQITGRFAYQVFLVNESGRYRVREWRSVNPLCE